MNPDSAQARSPAPPMLARLRTRAGASGMLSFRDFMEEALYAPGVGYYRRADSQRVGRTPNADFYTSSSLQGGIFGRLMRAAAANLLAPAAAADHALVEIAAEPGKD